MKKIRIYEIAKELNLPSKEIIKEAVELGVKVKAHSSTVTDEEYEIIKESLKETKEKTEPVQTESPLSAKNLQPEKGLLPKEKKSKISIKNLHPRAPIVTVMGHVDHGKTLLLDKICHTNIIAGESGGITQHIGASKIKIKGKGDIVFIDTPGHEAFTAMRARGAGITDIVVLVVAADDGIMPQTIEAINHAKAGDVPVIVAINKIDLPDANAEKIRTQLSRHELLTEKWGGDTITVAVSAKTGKNIEELLEMILLQAEVLELKSEINCSAKAVVLESELDKWIGSTASLIVTEGTLKIGDSFICGSAAGKIKAMTDSFGKKIKSADPSTPVKVIGFENLPDTGDILEIVKDRTLARKISKKRKEDEKQKGEVFQPKKITLEDLRKQLLGEEKKELRMILKTDVAGTLEAIKDALIKLGNEEVPLNIIHSGIGAVTKKDIMLASASNAIIIGFNISTNSSIKKEAAQENIQIRTYRIIYEIIDDIKLAMEGMLVPEEKEVLLGRVEVKKIYNISGVGTIAGCLVINGIVKRVGQVRVLRDSVIVYQGKIAALKRFKKDVSEVQSGYECGINIENFNDIKTGDIIESFEISQRKRKLEEVK